MKELIYGCCRELRLSAALADHAMTMSGDSNREHLFNILKAEIQYRANKRRTLCLKQSGFDSIKTFEGYYFERINFPLRHNN